MILGRSTVQWTALITAAGAFLQVLLVTLAPALDPVVVATIIGSAIGFLGVAIAFIANSSTTPTATPQLKVGTPVTVTDAEGAVLGHAPVPTPDGQTDTPGVTG